MNRVLVTGATGFVGSVLCETLAQSGFVVRAAVRSGRAASECGYEQVIVGDLSATTDWDEALRNVDCVVHTAARVHVLHDTPANANLYLEANAQGTRGLAAASARAGVRRFVFLSSIKVNGEQTTTHPFAASDPPHPLDHYGDSKLQAEQALAEIARTSAMQVTVVRPPLVYGPGVRANFRRLLSSVYRGTPLPLGSIANARSMVSVWNLCDLIRRALELQVVLPGVLMVSDGMDMSTPELIRRVARAMNRPVRLLPVPVALLQLAGKVTNKSAEVGRLLGSLQVDITDTRRALGWTPPISVEEGLSRTAKWYLQARESHEI